MEHSKCLLTTSFALLHEAQACKERYRHLAAALGGITEYGKVKPVPLSVILETNGLDDALWALCAVQPEQKELCEHLARLFACDCAERVIHLYEQAYPDDKRPRQAIDVARKFARGEITADELAAAWAAAGAAAVAAARDAARAAARDAAWAAAWAAAGDAARDAAWAAEQEFQRGRLIYYLFGGE